MKKSFYVLFAAFFLVVATGLPAFADQYVLGTSDPLYDVNWATRMVDGTGYIPASEDPDTTDTYYYSSWQDGTDTREEGIFALGTPDVIYGDPSGTYEMWGGATGFNAKQAVDNWMVLGFDSAIQNITGNDLMIYLIGGWGGSGMEVLVSSDSTYTSVDDMTWVSLGLLDINTGKPFTWGDYGTSPYVSYDLSDYGVTEAVNYVMFEGNGYWIDAVGSPVPIPAAVFLLAPGLLSLIGIRRKRR